MNVKCLCVMCLWMMLISFAGSATAENPIDKWMYSPDLLKMTARTFDRNPLKRHEIFHRDHFTDWIEVKSETVTGNIGLRHIVWETKRPAFGDYDRIALHRITKKTNESARCPGTGKVFFLLPGSWEAGGWSKISDPSFNTLLFLAENGYDVFTMNYRSAFVPNMPYELLDENHLDIAGAIDWNFGTYREDIKACVEKIKCQTRTDKIFMGGFSRGATLMFIYANKYQNDLKGLVTLDGWMKDYPRNPTLAMDEVAFNKLRALLAQGRLPVGDSCTGILCPPAGTMYKLFSEPSWDDYDTWQLAGVVPLSPMLAGEPVPPEFDTVSDYVADHAYTMWGDAILSNYYGGQIRKEILITALSEFSRYYPSIQDFEWWQLEAWEDVPYLDYDDNTVNLPAIAFLTPLFCTHGACLGDLFPNKTINEDVTIHYLADYGHMDLMFGENSMEDVKQPLLQWLLVHE